MHMHFITLALLTHLFSELFTSAKNSVVSASNSRDYKINVVGLFEVIKHLLQDEKKNSDVILSKIQNLENSLAGVQAAIFKMERKEVKSCATINSKNCAERKQHGDLTSGVRTVYPYGNSTDCPIDVFCDQTTDEGGWTVIQSGSPVLVRERFERGWQEYVHGFGDLNGEFWLGLENIHTLTNSTPMELRIDLEDSEGEKRYAKYGIFHVGDAASKYVLRIDNYTGDAGDAMLFHADKNQYLNGMKFSTHDQDNDLYSGSCAKDYRGGWWFKKCFRAHLNGYQFVGKPDNKYQGIIWEPFRGYYSSMKKASMKVRPV